jgi:uncharacterized protein (TIGR00255 family)
MTVVKMPAPVRSMTGFARVLKSTERGEITVSIKSLNHRGLDLHFHLPPDLDAFEGSMRAAIKRSVTRGHLDIRAFFSPLQAASNGALNEPLFRAWLTAFRKAAEDEGLDTQPDLNQAFRIPGMFGAPAEQESDTAIEKDLVAALEEALDSLNQFRTREGDDLVSVMRLHNRSVGEYCAEFEELRIRALPALQNRLNERLRELLRGTGLDPQRLAQEAAMLADRSDIGEEIARLKIHSKQLDALLDSGGEVGKKLDFLLQEMNRETNTILSKTTGIGDLGMRITDLALAAKADIEKIREQALNLE